MMMDLKKLEDKLNYSFHDRDLLLTALTHSSYAKEKNRGVEFNERLEFLGDAFLDAIIGEEFYMRFTDREEGFLSRMRAAIVCERSLAEKAEEIGLGAFIRLSNGEDKTGGRKRHSILADAMEAVIGAVYLDGGFEEVKKVVLRLFENEVEEASAGQIRTVDHKTALQEKMQAMGITDIRYEILEETGPDHDKTFVTGLFINGELRSKGKGKNKKQAQQEAARITLEGKTDNAL